MIDTSTNTSFIEAEQYSAFILLNLVDALLPGRFYRNVTDFGSGTTLNIKTIGERTIQDVAENEAFDYTPIDSGNVTLTITDQTGDAFFVTDDMREDGSQIDRLLAESAAQSVRKIAENFETKFLKACNDAQTVSDPNDINGFPHRIASDETNDVISLDHFREMKLSFDKANVPYAGRVAIIDPVGASTLDALVTTTVSVDRNPEFKGEVMRGGFGRDHDFIMNLFGWNIITSNRLDTVAAETVDSIAVANAVANVFMSVSDDSTKPMMAAWRRLPKTESGRNKDLRRDEFVTSTRYGIGSQRQDTLGILLTSAVNA